MSAASSIRGASLTHGADAMVRDAPALLARARTFHTLDALRGISALAVVLLHAGFFLGLPRPAEGQLAVDLFFVMSGFIIAHRYRAELEGGMRFTDFLRVRLIRLYPLYLLGAVLGVLPAVLAVASGEHDAFHVGLVKSLPLHLMMLPSPFAWPRIDELYPFNYVAWSLAFEVAINLLYAATIRFWTAPRLVVLIAASVIGLAICAARYGSLKYGYAWAGWPVGVVRILFAFPLGVLLQHLLSRRELRLLVPWWATLIAAAALFMMPPPVARPVWEFLCIVVAVPAIAVAAVANEPPRALHATCAVAGIFSYVAYSLHAPFVGLYLRAEAVLHANPEVETPLKAALFAAGLVALCVAAHVVYDKPVRRWLSHAGRGHGVVDRGGKKLSLST